MDYGQQNNSNPYAGSQIGAQAQDIREASLRNKADETAKYLMNAHQVLDELEDALQGPQPRSAEKEKVSPPGHPGLRSVLGDNSAQAAMLMSRLQTLLGAL